MESDMMSNRQMALVIAGAIILVPVVMSILPLLFGICFMFAPLFMMWEGFKSLVRTAARDS